MFRKLLLASVAVPLILSPQAQGKPAELDDAIKLYDAGQYAQAQTVLADVIKSGQDSAAAHYYLANTLIQQRKINAALAEYETAYKLEPESKIGLFSKQVLARFGKTPEPQRKDNGAAKDVLDTADVAVVPKVKTKAGIPPAPPVQLQIPPDVAALIGCGSECKEPAKAEKTIDVKTLQTLLPKIPSYPKEKTRAGVFLGMNEDDRAEKVEAAYDRRWRASDRVTEAKCILENAEAIIREKTMPPVSLGKGAKKPPLKKEFAGLLDPYKKYLSDCEQALARENRVLEACSKARDAVDPYPVDRGSPPAARQDDMPPIIPDSQLNPDGPPPKEDL